MKKFMILVLCLGVSLALCGTDSWACSGVTSAGNVKGNNSGWTLIGTVQKGSIMKVRASGKVDFGCKFCTCVDGPTAGVEGKSLTFVKIFDTLKQQTDAAKTLNPFDAAEKNINALKRLFGSTHQPNFDQGGVWIKVVTKNGTPYLATQHYYFWEHGDGINKYGLPINEDVDVYAKAHDGGKSPDATKSYGDNKGAYTVRIESNVIQSTPGGSASSNIYSAQPVGQTTGSKLGGRVSSPQVGGQTQYIPGTSPGSGGTSPGGHSAQPVGQTPSSQMGTQAPGSQQVSQAQYTSATGQGTRINVKSCTTCAGGCTAGHTCIYVNNACFVSCQ
jgi:hypothetical protein